MLTPVLNENDIQAVARLAETIWREYFTSVISDEQISYMLQRSQSPGAITRQINSKNYHYFFISPYLDPVGYVAVVPKKESLFVSKLFVGMRYRGKGYGESVLHELETIARGVHKLRITLRVNKNNNDSIAFFHKHGYKQVGNECTDIGNGFVMDDILMAKVLK